MKKPSRKDSVNWGIEIKKQLLTVLISVIISSIFALGIWNVQYNRQLENEKMIQKLNTSKEVTMALLQHKKAVIDRLEYTVIENSERNNISKEDINYLDYYNQQRNISELSPKLYEDYLRYEESEIVLFNEFIYATIIFDINVNEAIEVFKTEVINKGYGEQISIYEDFLLERGDLEADIYQDINDKSIIIYEINDFKYAITKHYNHYSELIINAIRMELSEEI